MPARARPYIGFVIAAGLVSLATGLPQWTCADPARFTFYFLIALLCSSMKVVLPGIPGNMSVSNILVLVGVLELSLGETLVMAIGGTLWQSYWRPRKRPQPIQVAFNVFSVALATTGAFYAWGLAAMSAHTAHVAVRLVAASAAFFVLNTVSIALVIGVTEGKQGHWVWRDCYFWTFPYYLLGASIAGAMHLVSRTFGWQISVLVLPVVYGLYRSYRMYLTQLEQEKIHAQELAGLHLRTIEALALAIEAKDDTTHEHLCRVQVYAQELGKQLGLSPGEVRALEAASILHDIGKLAVPDSIISKPGRLTPEEFDKMKIHPVVGAEILERVRFPYPVVPIVRHHHEKWDGSGYPDGLKGEEIPIGARILSAVDCLDALASDRQYRKALPIEKALAFVVAESGKSFDPRVVRALEERAIELEQIARARSVSEPPLKLSRPEIEGDHAPAAGFESSADPPGELPKAAAPDFLISIAEARQEMLAFYDLIHDLGNSLSLQETLGLLGSRLKQLIPHDGMAIYIRRGDVLHPSFAAGESSRLFGSLEIPVGDGLSGWVAQNSKAIINGNPAVETGHVSDPARVTRLRSALAVPLQGADGLVAGVLALYRLEKDAFSRDHFRILNALSPKLTVAIQNALKYQKAEQNATTDALTGLPNSRFLFPYLDSELSRCRRNGQGLTVLVCDLDGFKQVNDRYGHITGNKVLASLARRMRASCREYDCVARMGGDEFVIVLSEFPPGAVEAKIESLNGIAREVGREACGGGHLGISAGYARFPEDGGTAEELLAQADRRMYLAKHARATAFTPLVEVALELE